MCGIAGSIRWNTGVSDVHHVERMCAAMVHRGPDAGAVVADGGGVLGHRRLSVIDTAESANQPMRHSEHRSIIVFNGEIYNYRELRRELESLGHRFTTQSDTEVLLAAFVQWDIGSFERFNGMFACGIWQPDRKRLVLARDRLGKKPLYFHHSADGVLFASELTALSVHPQVPNRLNESALGHFLTLGYTLTEGCILEGVEKVPPASVIVFEAGREPTRSTYWDLASCFRTKRAFASEEEAIEELASLIDDATRLRLVSDVPLGAFLSGGLDSATIVEVMRRFIPPDSVRTFTVGFQEQGFDEAPQAEETASALGVNHRTGHVSMDVAETLINMVRHSDEPFADTSTLPFHHLAQFARQDVTVALSGDGGDELFAGYVTYTADRIHRFARHIPAPVLSGLRWCSEVMLPTTFGKVSFDYKVRQFLAGAAQDFPAAHWSWRSLFSAEEKRTLLRPGLEAAAKESWPSTLPHFEAVSDCHWLDQATYVDIKTWLVDDILVKVDRATMAHSLEARAPLLDYRLVEFAAALPPSWKLNGWTKKYLLRRLAGQRLPAKVLNRPKSGFSAPVSRWLLGPLEELARSATTSGPILDLVSKGAVESLWAEHKAMRRDNGYRLFALTCLGLWLQARAR